MAARRLTADIHAGIDHADRLRADADLARLRAELAATQGRYKAALRQIDAERERADSLAGLAGIKGKAMPRRSKPARPNSATAVVVRTAPALCPPDDWHSQEGFIGSRQAMESWFYRSGGGLAGMLVADGVAHAPARGKVGA